MRREGLMNGPARIQTANIRSATLGKIVAAYDYVDEAGKPLFQVVRFDPVFRQRRQDDRGGWSWSVKGVRPVPYDCRS